jgi:cytochrome o ubiquinol oxidase subunit III
MYVRSFKPADGVQTWMGRNLVHVAALLVTLLLAMKLTLALVHTLQTDGLGGSALLDFGRSEALYLLGAVISVSALVWLARPHGAVDFTEHHAVDVESMGLYWHFVDIVWIVIFTAVYLLEYL